MQAPKGKAGVDILLDHDCLRLLLLLCDRPATVVELAEYLSVPDAVVNYHLTRLCEVSLVVATDEIDEVNRIRRKYRPAKAPGEIGGLIPPGSDRHAMAMATMIGMDLRRGLMSARVANGEPVLAAEACARLSNESLRGFLDAAKKMLNDFSSSDVDTTPRWYTLVVALFPAMPGGNHPARRETSSQSLAKESSGVIEMTGMKDGGLGGTGPSKTGPIVA